MRRTASRPIPGGRIEAGPVLGFGIFLALASHHADVSCDEHAGRDLVDRLDPVLRRDLHHVAEASDAAEHRHRRCRGCVPAHHRLGRRDGLRRRVTAADVRDHLLLDPRRISGPCRFMPPPTTSGLVCRCSPSSQARDPPVGTFLPTRSCSSPSRSRRSCSVTPACPTASWAAILGLFFIYGAVTILNDSQDSTGRKSDQRQAGQMDL